MNPSIIFAEIPDWEAYIDEFVITNGVQEITGLIGNNSFNGAVTFIKKSPLNWSKAQIFSTGGNIGLTGSFLGVVIIMGTPPTSITWTDNFYHEYVIINLTTSDIPVKNPLVYYDLTGTPVMIIPANSCVDIVKANNDLWVERSFNFGTTAVGKQPKTFVVGQTPGAPVAGTNTWTVPDFKNSYVVLVMSRSVVVDLSNVGDGSPFITKLPASATLTITNYTWQDQDILTYILIPVSTLQPSISNLVPYNLTADTMISALTTDVPDNTVVTFQIQPNGFNYTWDSSFVFSDNYPMQGQGTANGVGTVQKFDFTFLLGKWRASDQSLNMPL